jgi:protein O-mannosyl-transferase
MRQTGRVCGTSKNIGMREAMKRRVPAQRFTSTWIARFALPALLAPLVFVCFAPALSNDFVNWDDHVNFTYNPHYRGLSASHLRWMFTTLYMGPYQPLSWVTHGVVYMIWGLNPLGYHLVNLLLHAANAVLVYFLILALFQHAGANNGQGRGLGTYVAAAIGALFFAIHPLRVEAVAWATERREVLSACFLMLTLFAYLRMVDVAGPRGETRRKWLGVSLGCYALSLLSKASGMTLPVVLVILDVYPLRRLGPAASVISMARSLWSLRASKSDTLLASATVDASDNQRKVLIEKLPYAALASAAAITAFVGQRHADATRTLAGHGIFERAMQAMYGLSFYLWKTAAPVHLSPLYPLEEHLDPMAPRYLLSALFVAAITAAALRWRRRYPWALAAWAAYVVTVSPVLGFVQSGPQIAADRYTYVACLPWAVLVAAGVQRVWRAWESHRPPWPGRLAAAAAVAAALSGLALSTHAQTSVWRDSLTLWMHALQVDPTNHIAYTNRGAERERRGDADAALADFETAIRLSPDYAMAHSNRGYILQQKGNLDGALTELNLALRLDPKSADAYTNRGTVLQAKGDSDGALADFNRALKLQPEHAKAHSNRGYVRQAKGDLDGAIDDLNRAIDADPSFANAYNNRAMARYAKGDVQAAVDDLNRAIALNPVYVDAYYNRAIARKRQGDLDGAITDYDQVLRLNPRHANAFGGRGTVRQAKGDLNGAIIDYQRAVQLTTLGAPSRVMFERSLAAAQAQAERAKLQ